MHRMFWHTLQKKPNKEVVEICRVDIYGEYKKTPAISAGVFECLKFYSAASSSGFAMISGS